MFVWLIRWSQPFPRFMSPFCESPNPREIVKWKFDRNNVLTHTRPSHIIRKICEYILDLAYCHEGETSLSICFMSFFIPPIEGLGHDQLWMQSWAGWLFDLLFLLCNLMEKISSNPKKLITNTWSLSTARNGWNDRMI